MTKKPHDLGLQPAATADGRADFVTVQRPTLPPSHFHVPMPPPRLPPRRLERDRMYRDAIGSTLSTFNQAARFRLNLVPSPASYEHSSRHLPPQATSFQIPRHLPL